MLTNALAMLRSGLTRTSLTVTRLPANMAMPLPADYFRKVALKLPRDLELSRACRLIH